MFRLKLQQLENTYRSLLQERFARNLGWLGLAELGVRVTRIFATIALARCLDAAVYGVAAIALTVHELVFVLARNGLGAKIIQCASDELDSVTHLAYRLNAWIAVGLFVLQAALAWPIAWFYGRSELAPMILALALIHLVSPFSLVAWAMIQRLGRLNCVAKLTVLVVGCDNLLTAILAFGGLGAWAAVLPKVVVAPVWVLLLRRAHPWQPRSGFRPTGYRDVFIFGRRVLGVEVVRAVRAQADYLLVGRFLGLEVLGLYYLAFNAGLGFSQTIIRSFGMALYPDLCASRGVAEALRERLHGAYRTVAMTGVPLILLQCLLAPLYVPLIFGPQWTPAVPILILICLSALPRLLDEGASQLLRAVDRPDLDLRFNVMFTAAFLGSVLIGLQGGAVGVAFAVLVIHLITLPPFAVWTYQKLNAGFFEIQSARA